VADDATAAVWNPAGLVQLERPELSVVATYLTTAARFGDGSVADGMVTTRFAFGSDEGDDRSDLNFLSATLPFTWLRRNLVLSFNYHQRYDFHDELTFSNAAARDDPILPSTVDQRFEISSEGGIGAISPALAVEVTPRLSLGLAINLLRNEFLGGEAYAQRVRLTTESRLDLGLPAPIGTASATFARRSEIDFDGVNATLGLLWRPWERGARHLTLGAVVETPFTADLDRRTRTAVTEAVQDGLPQPDTLVETETDYDIDFPTAVTLGAALRLSDRTTAAVDVGWTDWSVWVQEDRATGDKTRPLGGAPAATEVEDTWAVRLGVEQVLAWPAGQVPVRAGLFYEPRAGLEEAQEIYGFSLGAGLTRRRFSLDAAYQFRTGDDLAGQNISAELRGTHFDVEEHLLLLSLILYR
jgi:long-subunit fatty acid transport protein